MKLLPTATYSRFRRLVLAACASAPFATFGQPLYQWSFDDANGVPSVTAGGGTLVANGTALFTGVGASGLAGDSSLSLSNGYTGGTGSGNSASAGGANVLTGVGTLSKFTVTMWVNVAAGSLSQFPRLFELGDTATPDSPSNPGINMLLNSGALEISVNQASGNRPQVGMSFTPGQWKFVVFTYDSAGGDSNFELYGQNNDGVVLSGSLTNPVTVTGSRNLAGAGGGGTVALGTAATLYLGNRAGGDRGYTGRIDDVRLYNTQLTLEELEAIRLETAPPPPSGGVPYYWKGAVGSAWNAANWTSDLAGTTVAALPTDGSAAATFFANGASNFTNTLLGAAQNVKSIVFNTQGAAVDIGGTHSLTIGAGGIALDASSGATSLSTTGEVILGANQTWTNNAATPLTVSSVLSGAFTLTTAGTGQITLSAANTHAGITIEGGTLKIEDVGSLGPVNTELNVAEGTLDLNGLSPQVGKLSGANLGTLTNRAEGTTSTLVVNTSAAVTDTFGGHLNNGSATQMVALTKTGPGTLVLSATSTFTGNILVSDGTLTPNVSLFVTPNSTSIGQAQTPGRTVTIQNGATFHFGNFQIFGNGAGDFSLLPSFIVEAGGTISAASHNIIGGITLLGGTVTQTSTDPVGYLFKGPIVAGGGVASLISSSTNTANHLDSNTGIDVAAASSLTISTPLADDGAPCGFTKTGPGTLTLSAANTYTGPTTLAAGTLALSSATSLSDTATFEVNDPLVAALQLNFTGYEIVSDFTIGGVSPGPGTYGRIGSGATHTYAWITGNGMISIGTPPSSTPIQDWRQTYFGTTEATGNAANDADPDADGVVNLLEYGLGGDPTVAENDLLPVQAVNAGHLELSFSRIADATLIYSVEASNDLASWTSVWSSTGVDNTEGVVTVPDPEALSAHARRFLRLRVTSP